MLALSSSHFSSPQLNGQRVALRRASRSAGVVGRRSWAIGNFLDLLHRTRLFKQGRFRQRLVAQNTEVFPGNRTAGKEGDTLVREEVGDFSVNAHGSDI